MMIVIVTLVSNKVIFEIRGALDLASSNDVVFYKEIKLE